MSLNDDVADVFESMSVLLDLKGEPVFKAISFAKVSRLIRESDLDLRACAAGGTLCDVQGIGKSSQQVIEEIVRTGRSTAYEELRASVPPGLLPMLKIGGLGPKTIHLFWKQRGITNIEELISAIDGGKLSDLKGVGEKKLESIKAGILMMSQSAGRVGIVHALPMGDALVARVRTIPTVKHAEIAGSLRRRRETVGDLDVVCSLAEGAAEKAGGIAAAQNAVTLAFTQFPEVERVLVQGNTKASVIVAGGLQADIRIVPADCYGAALLYFTGSKEHNVKIRGWALDAEMTLNEWGLYDLAAFEKAPKKSGEPPQLKSLAGKTEADIYKKLKLRYIEPELREDRGELEAARDNKLPSLIELADIHGDLHSHTTASDGTNSIEEMAEAAIAKGYQFLGITDHSKSQVIANGLTAERLIKHAAAIRKANDRFRGQIHLLAGCEVDILPDGKMDYEDAVLAELDFVVGSPHISLKQDEAKATDRIKRAIENRYVSIIGHPTGRYIDRRAGLPLRLEELLPPGRGQRHGAGDQQQLSPAGPERPAGPPGDHRRGDALDQHRRPQHRRVKRDGLRHQRRPPGVGDQGECHQLPHLGRAAEVHCPQTVRLRIRRVAARPIAKAVCSEHASKPAATRGSGPPSRAVPGWSHFVSWRGFLPREMRCRCKSGSTERITTKTKPRSASTTTGCSTATASSKECGSTAGSCSKRPPTSAG